MAERDGSIGDALDPPAGEGTGEVVDQARRMLEGEPSDSERASALLVLGRNAYYANQMGTAVELLRKAMAVTDDPDLTTEVVVSLAIALSKQGDSDEALELLDEIQASDDPGWATRIHNQRGIILTELGRLEEARIETARAVRLSSGEDVWSIRSRVNLAVIASMLSDLDESEGLYEEALVVARATGEDVIAAGIEGNLGYVASRRGDFATALDWYARARRTFEELGEVDLLAAVLEVDHARTLLDVGLAVDAVEATDRATRSAAEGGNQMLELQSRLLCAEALVMIGDHRSAIPEIERSHELAEALDHVASQRRIVYLAGEIGLDVAGLAAVDEIDEIVSFVDAGWGPEAYRWMLRRAVAMRHDDPDGAKALVAQADLLTASVDVDPVAQAIGRMLIACVDRDRDAVDAGLDLALRALNEQIELVGSAEIHTTMTHPVRLIAEIAIDTHLGMDEAAESVLSVLERCRYRPPRSRPGTADADSDESERLRDARVRLDATKSSGGDAEAVASEVRDIERGILQRRRRIAGGSIRQAIPDRSPTPPPPDGTVLVTQVAHGDRLLGVRRDSEGTEVADLGPLDECAQLGLTQRAALRRIADRRRRRPDGEARRVRSVSLELEDRLLRPLGVDLGDRVVFCPAAQIRHLCWGALPSFEQRRLTIGYRLADWFADAEQLSVRRLGFLGGPRLESSSAELADVGSVWGRPDAIVPLATADDAAHTLERADLVHIAAHGSFRSDNSFFSSLVFEDRELSILEMCDLERVPSVVVLASCDAGASGNPTGLDDDVTVGTAKELRQLGASVVVAPTVAVNDAAAAEFSVGLHRGLVAGKSIDDAFFSAKRSMIESGDPVRMATAWAFNLMGGRSTQQPLRIGR